MLKINKYLVIFAYCIGSQDENDDDDNGVYEYKEVWGFWL